MQVNTHQQARSSNITRVESSLPRRPKAKRVHPHIAKVGGLLAHKIAHHQAGMFVAFVALTGEAL